MRNFSWQESTKHIVSNSFFDTWQKEPYFQSSFPRHFWCAMFMNFRWPSKFWESRDISNHQFSRDFLKFQSFWYFRPINDIADHYMIFPTITQGYCRPLKDIADHQKIFPTVYGKKIRIVVLSHQYDNWWGQHTARLSVEWDLSRFLFEQILVEKSILHFFEGILRKLRQRPLID